MKPRIMSPMEKIITVVARLWAWSFVLCVAIIIGMAFYRFQQHNFETAWFIDEMKYIWETSFFKTADWCSIKEVGWWKYLL
jgi:TRAP-type mannitol/chloroaromatic compound transport system permease small subunit